MRRVRHLALLVKALHAKHLSCGDDLLAADGDALTHDEHLVAPVSGNQNFLLRRERLLLDGQGELDDERLRAVFEEVYPRDPRVHAQGDLRSKCGRHLLKQRGVRVHVTARHLVLEVLAQANSQLRGELSLVQERVELAHECVERILLAVRLCDDVSNRSDDVTVHERPDEHGG